MWKKNVIKNLKIGVLGGTKSTLISLETLKNNNFNNLEIFYYVPIKQKHKVEYCNLKKEFNFKDYKYCKFTKIKSIEKKLIKNKYDILICIGLTQLISKNIIKNTKYGCLGFHPSNLPEGKGRSAVAWNILKKKKYRVTFFKIDDKIDNGKILIKSKFGPSNLDANNYYKRIYNDIKNLLIPSIKRLLINKNTKALKDKKKEFYALRSYGDGFINFLDNKKDIMSLIKASSFPHPGAYACFQNKKYIVNILKDKKNNTKFYAVPGTILEKENTDKYLVMAGNGPICLKIKGNFRIGQRFLTLNMYNLYSLLKKNA